MQSFGKNPDRKTFFLPGLQPHVLKQHSKEGTVYCFSGWCAAFICAVGSCSEAASGMLILHSRRSLSLHPMIGVQFFRAFFSNYECYERDL